MTFLRQNLPALLLLLLGGVCFAWGILRGEQFVVFTKAVNLCLECIGIG